MVLKIIAWILLNFKIIDFWYFYGIQRRNFYRMDKVSISGLSNILHFFCHILIKNYWLLHESNLVQPKKHFILEKLANNFYDRNCTSESRYQNWIAHLYDAFDLSILKKHFRRIYFELEFFFRRFLMVKAIKILFRWF